MLHPSAVESWLSDVYGVHLGLSRELEATWLDSLRWLDGWKSQGHTKFCATFPHNSPVLNEIISIVRGTSDQFENQVFLGYLQGQGSRTLRCFVHLSVCGVTIRAKKFAEIARETDGLPTHSFSIGTGAGVQRQGWIKPEMRLNRWQDHLVRQSVDTCEQPWLTRKGNEGASPPSLMQWEGKGKLLT